MFNKCQLVRQTCGWAYAQAKHVTINKQKLALLADKFTAPKPYNEDAFHHSSQEPERALLQVFMIDCLNFCFWPLEHFQYDRLCSNIQQSVQSGITLNQLTKINEEQLITSIFKGAKLPLADERARILRQMSRVVSGKFEGSFVKLIQSANNSAVSLLRILTENFDNFQDHAIYKGRQIHFYKRAQILIGHIYAKYQGKGLGYFHDIHQLTMYPDYRVPQLFDQQGVFQYSEELRSKIQNKEEITDRVLEVEIRASTVVAVEELKECLLKKGVKALSIELDGFLWQRGEANLASLPPHHRCLTIYY